jgi:Putative zinc-RING and/or ribbon
MASKPMNIPWKVAEEFDMNLYPVCYTVVAELENCYDKPNLELADNSTIIRKFPVLSEFTLLKKELHLLYDSICRPSILTDLMPSHANLLIKKNLLSIKNFVEIKDGSLPVKMKDWLRIFRDHFRGCERCTKKGLICGGCRDATNKVFLFEISATRVCRRCHTLFHRTCWAVKGCSVCEKG